MHGVIKDDNYVKFEDEKEMLRIADGSWTIKIKELTKDVRYIIYITDKARYGISRAKAEQNGFVRRLGNEEKLVVPLKFWTMKL